MQSKTKDMDTFISLGLLANKARGKPLCTPRRERLLAAPKIVKFIVLQAENVWRMKYYQISYTLDEKTRGRYEMPHTISILKALKKYIPLGGHRCGYWLFTSFPQITTICYANNLIAVKIRKSWFCGEEIWYIKDNGKFVRREEPAGEWIE